jgi:hypothetical protein
MTHTPPVPDANTPPYPPQPEPHEAGDFESNFAFPIGKSKGAAGGTEGGWDPKTLIGIGAGLALGAAAAVGALIFGRPSKTKAAPARRTSATPKAPAKSAARKAAPAKSSATTAASAKPAASKPATPKAPAKPATRKPAARKKPAA